MRNAKGQVSGGENKGIRLSHVRARAELFQACLPINCKHHGRHLEWVEYTNAAQVFPTIRCKTCMNNQAKKWVRNNYLHALATWTKRRDIATEIDEEFLKGVFLKQDGRCALTGVSFDAEHRPSLDRIDSTVGYKKANVQLVLGDINRMKTNLALDTFLMRCKQVAHHALDSAAS